MGFFSKFFTAAVKIAITPVAVAADVVKVATGDKPDTTEALLKSAGEDLEDAGDDLAEGNA